MENNQPSLAELQARLDNLEARTAFQDDVIEQLNDEITVHQEQLSNINEQLKIIGQRVKEINASPVAGAEEEAPPPHY